MPASITVSTFAPLRFRHRSYDAADVARHLDSYLTTRPDWAILDHDKPGLANAETAVSAVIAPRFDALRMEGEELEVACEMGDGPGAPESLFWRLTPHPEGLEAALVVRHKPANRMPEAGFLTVDPAGASPWELLKTGLWIDSTITARRGGGALHAIFAARTTGLELEPLDAALASAAGADFMRFDAQPPRYEEGLCRVLYNNKWGTNFPMWWEGDLVSRLILRPQPA